MIIIKYFRDFISIKCLAFLTNTTKNYTLKRRAYCEKQNVGRCSTMSNPCIRIHVESSLITLREFSQSFCSDL